MLSWIIAISNLQGLPQNSPTGVTLRELEFSVYPIGQASWSDIYYQAQPGVYQTLTFWSYERSPKHRFKGLSPMEFYRKEMLANGDVSYQVVATTPVESRAEDLLLFFHAIKPETPGSKQEFQILALDEGRQVFPLDTVTFVNATGANLEGVFGNKPIFLKHGISAPYDLKPFFKEETLIGLAVQYEGNLQKVLHSKWSFYPDYREIVLLLPPGKAGSLRIQAFRISQHREEMSPSAATTEPGE